MEVSAAIISQIKKKKREHNSRQEEIKSITQKTLEPRLQT
jgi:hypothetical protein